MKKTSGMIATGHQKTAIAAQEMFGLGGNAFDAAIAALLASFVVEFTLNSAAGGGFFLAYTKEHQKMLFDFFSQTPRQKRPISELDFYDVDINFGGETQAFHIGLGSMAVPGNLAGVFQVHKQLGKLPFSVVAEPAISYAKNGFTITKFQNFAIKLLEPILLARPENYRLYAPNGKILSMGEISYFSDLGNILTELSTQGIKEFYQGDMARQIVKDCQEYGGHLTLEDLTNYQVIIREPLQISYRDYELLTNPPPSSGGILIALGLKLLEKSNLENISYRSKEHLEILAHIMCLTNQIRTNHYDDYIYENEITEKILETQLLEQYVWTNKWGSTTHISVIDQEGNAASVTTSNGEGSAYVIPNTGIMLNNMLGEADLNPKGFHNWQCDQRISSMMSPTILLKKGKPEMVLGSGGSNRIRTAILQVISNLIDWQMSMENAVQSPRVHWENQIYSIEPPSELELFEQMNLPDATKVVLWAEKNMFFGGVNGVKTNINGFEGAGDERREGIAIMV